MKTILLTLIVSFSTSFIFCQTATLVKNINPQDEGTGISDEKGYIGTDYIFVGDKKLWRTDGTPAGTSIVKDFNLLNANSIARLTTFGSVVVFSVGGSTNQLWKTDGTESGTVMLKDFGTYTIMFYRAVVGGNLFFGGGDATNGNELWKTDGTPGGTVLVKNIAPGSANSSPQSLTAFGSNLLFIANTAATGSALWKSDGSDAGTVLVKDLDAGSTSFASFGEMTVGNSKAFFSFGDVATGREPWVTDGTDAGTFRLLDINPGTAASFPENFTNVNNKIYFTAQDATNGQLWTTDGTAANTVPFFDLVPNSKNDQYRYLYNSNGTLFFSATTNSVGLTTEPYVSNGTVAGTIMLKGIVAGANGSDARGYQYLNGTAYFIANTLATGYELWKTDGTEANTSMVKEIYPGTPAGIGGTYTINGVVNDKIVFSGVDPIYNAEPFVSDGTPAGTLLLKNLQTRGLGGYPSNLTVIGNRIYFSGVLGFSDAEPYYSDGTEAGTQKLKELEPAIYSNPFDFVNADNTNFFFNTYNGSVRSIYQSNGTEAGTAKIVNDVQSERMAYVNGILFFVKRDATNGTELWKYEAGSASLVKNINGGSANSFPAFLRSYNNQLYFFASTTANGQELWKSDGTDVGTTIVADINPGTSGVQVVSDLFVHNGSLYYFARTGSTNSLIKSNGTTVGTEAIKTFAGTDEFGRFYSFDNSLFFSKKSTNGSDHVNLELWKSDGSGTGTTLVKELLPYTADIEAEEMHALSFYTNGSQFFFYAERENFFNETSQINFWRSDGTVGGTTQLKTFTYAEADEGNYDFEEGVRYIASYDANNVLFVYPSATNGEEIWKSDGTAGGTNLAIDINPGSQGSAPSDLTTLGSAIYLSAAGNNDLNELWRIAATAPLPLKLLNFTATRDGEKIQLRWKTSNEMNCSHFNVQRSNGSNDFKNIESVSARNTQSESYSTIDINPHKGVNFYRLQMFDNDGKYTFSQVVKIDLTESNVVSISPNPATDFFDVKGLRNLKRIVVMDINGRPVKAYNANTSGRYFISDVPAGTYLVQFITSDSQVSSARLIVK